MKHEALLESWEHAKQTHAFICAPIVWRPATPAAQFSIAVQDQAMQFKVAPKSRICEPPRGAPGWVALLAQQLPAAVRQVEDAEPPGL